MRLSSVKQSDFSKKTLRPECGCLRVDQTAIDSLTLTKCPKYPPPLQRLGARKKQKGGFDLNLLQTARYEVKQTA